MARDVDEENALAYSTAHESGTSNPAAERDMDMHNNKVGAAIGGKNPNAKDSELVKWCEAALWASELKLINDDRVRKP